MATITIRASDSAAALEEVMRLLGPEAMILSTRHHNGQIEMVASSDPSESAPHGDSPQAQPPKGAASAPRFDGHLRLALREKTGAMPLNLGQLPGRIVLAGPPGAGCSMLAARLAAEALRAPGAPRPAIIAPRPDLLCPPGPISAWARLLGLTPHRPIWPGGAPGPVAPPEPGETQILDLSALPQIAPETLGALAALPDAQLWLVLPSGLHAAYQDRICTPLSGLADMVVLTRTDLCPPTPDDLDLPARHGLRIGLMAQGAGLLDALGPHEGRQGATAFVNAPHQKEHSDAAACLS